MRVLDGVSWAWLGLFAGLAVGVPFGQGVIVWPENVVPIPTPFAPDVAPIEPAIKGVQALLIYETSPDNPLPAKQQAILTSPIVRTWLNSNCGKDDAGHPVWRMLDKDSKFADPDSGLAKAIQRPRESVPWLIVTNGKTGYEGPLPANVTDMMTLLEKYGGK